MSRTLPNVISNDWQKDGGGQIVVARILSHRTAPEGLDVERIRFAKTGAIELDAAVGHIVGVLSNEVGLRVHEGGQRPLRLTTTVHTYVPPHADARIEGRAGAEIVLVSGATTAQARGAALVVRDESFLAGSATGTQSLRWILTSQYLSRRIFLHHDQTLLSKSGAPVCWFRTTMFDVAGLPPNDDAEPVFKMQYNSRTEFNVCYDVRGRAQVRMAQHPYRATGQEWGSWLPLDEQSTYHVNEASGGAEEEHWIDPQTGHESSARNRHEVHIVGGHVTLFCLFDPAPTGIERHQPGEYSDYQPLSELVGTARYETYLRDVSTLDEMVDTLSLAKARGELASIQGSPLWRRYEDGRRAQVASEEALLQALALEGTGREQVVAHWATLRA